MKRKILIALGIAAVVVIVIVLALPAFIDANRFKPVIESDLATALGRNVMIGDIHLALFSGGVSADNLSIGDDPAFSQAPFLSARKLTVGVALLPLIFSKKLEVRSFAITDPAVSLIRTASGVWNFSTLGRNSSNAESKSSPAEAASVSPGSIPDVTVQDLVISGGKVTIRNANGRAREYQNVDVKASSLSYVSQFPFQITAQTPGNGSVKLDGVAGPVNGADASLTPFHAKIDVEHFDLSSTGFLDSASGLGGVVGFQGNVSSERGMLDSKGILTAEQLRLVPAATAARVPATVDYDTEYDLTRQSGTLRDGEVHIGKAAARLTGTYRTDGANPTIQMQLNGKGMDVPSLEGLLPAVGIALPSGASLTAGSLDLNLAIAGPANQLVITGPVNLSNAKLQGFDLKGQLGAVAAFAGLSRGAGKDTEIQTLSARLLVNEQGTQVDDLNVVVPSLGVLAGSGQISATGQLNCRMQAKVETKNLAINAVAAAISSFAGGAAASGAIPFKIQGTTSRPLFVPDTSAVLGKSPQAGPAGAQTKAAGILGGLFGKKKHQ